MWPFKKSNKDIAKEYCEKLGYILCLNYRSYYDCDNCGKDTYRIKQNKIIPNKLFGYKEIVVGTDYYYCSECQAISIYGDEPFSKEVLYFHEWVAKQNPLFADEKLLEHSLNLLEEEKNKILNKLVKVKEENKTTNDFLKNNNVNKAIVNNPYRT